MKQVNYQKLCLELFGTDDVEKLKVIAKKLHTSNARNAGRKQKFPPKDVETMEQMLAQGTSINAIAEHFHTTRQTISRYMNPPIPKACSMRMTYCCQHRPCTIIDVDFLHEQIYIQNRTSDLLHRAFGINEHPTWEDFNLFLKERCFPPSRGLLKERLQDLGLDSYDPLQIIEKTGGHTADDDMWIKLQYCPLNGVKS